MLVVARAQHWHRILPAYPELWVDCRRMEKLDVVGGEFGDDCSTDGRSIPLTKPYSGMAGRARQRVWVTWGLAIARLKAGESSNCGELWCGRGVKSSTNQRAHNHWPSCYFNLKLQWKSTTLRKPRLIAPMLEQMWLDLFLM